jgi:hypothetical protein
MPISNWSTIASNNGIADAVSGVSWPEGMAPGQINDSARAMMAEIKKWTNEPTVPSGGALSLVNSSNNYAVTLKNIGASNVGYLEINTGASFSGKVSLVAGAGLEMVNIANNYAITLSNAGASGAGYAYLTSSLTVNGSVTATAFPTSSDRRLKYGIEDLAAGDVVDRLRPVEFGWLSDPSSPKIPGFIAQEVHEVVPAAVMVGDSDPDKRSGDDGFEQWSLDNSRLVPYLVVELKALRARVAQLEAK